MNVIHLLHFVESVNFVDEENGLPLKKCQLILRFSHGFLHVGNAGSTSWKGWLDKIIVIELDFFTNLK